MSDQSQIPEAFEAGPSFWMHISEYLHQEILRGHEAITHAKLGFGAAQLLIIFLGLYAASRTVLAIVQGSETMAGAYWRYDLLLLFAFLLIISALAAVIWLTVLIQRLLRAATTAIREELYEKGQTLLKQISFGGQRMRGIPNDVVQLFQEMGVEATEVNQ